MLNETGFQHTWELLVSKHISLYFFSIQKKKKKKSKCWHKDNLGLSNDRISYIIGAYEREYIKEFSEFYFSLYFHKFSEASRVLSVITILKR